MLYVVYNGNKVEYKTTLEEVNEYIKDRLYSQYDPVLLFNFKFEMKDRYKVKDISSQLIGYEYVSGCMEIFLVCKCDV